jgi:RNA polymerase sigma factor (sigma-70 family)
LLAALPDERLVEQVRRGDPVAFEVLYDRFSGGILGFCRHMLGSQTDAEDAVQHTFIAAHADIERHGRRELHVKAWLYTIARNRCLSMLRSRREQPVSDHVELGSDRLADDVQQREDLRALLDDVGRLPDDQRAALVLAEVGDLSHEEIGTVLGCQAAKVKSLVFQARSSLIDRRTAREMPCQEIREQLATLRGGALRRSHLRNHLEICPGCTEYREQIRRQRAMLAVALPVLPSAALRSHVLGAAGIGGSSAAAAGAGAGLTSTGFGLAAQGGIAKLGIAAVLAVGGVGGAAAASNGSLPFVSHAQPSGHSSAASSAHGKAAAARLAHSGKSVPVAAGKNGAHGKHAAKTHTRSASGTAHGFTPTQGGSNGARARQFAQTRGKGAHTGITKQHTTAQSRRPATKRVHEKHVASPPAKTKAAPRTPTHPNTVHSAPPRSAPAKPAPQTAPTAPSTESAPATTPQKQSQSPLAGENGTGKIPAVPNTDTTPTG